MNSLNKPNGNNLNSSNLDNKTEITTEIIIGTKSNALDAKNTDITGETAQTINKIGNKIHQIITITTKIIDRITKDEMVSETLDQIMKGGEIIITITIETTKMIITPSEMSIMYNSLFNKLPHLTNFNHNPSKILHNNLPNKINTLKIIMYIMWKYKPLVPLL